MLIRYRVSLVALFTFSLFLGRGLSAETQTPPETKAPQSERQNRQTSMTVDNGISWEAAAAVIALCALGLTVWQAVVARRHNKLSVTPYLTTWSHSDGGNNRYQIDLLNNGIGPALIKSFLIQIDDRSISGEGTEPIEQALKILFPQYSYQPSLAYVANGYMMSEKESRSLAIIQFNGSPLPSPDEVKHAIKKARLIIDYESIYGDKHRMDTGSFR